MTGEWRSYPRAPAAGTPVCRSDELAVGAARSADLDGFPILLIRTKLGLKAYVNACPHQFLPLDYRSGHILSSDGRTLRCSNHEAGFDVETGAGVEGLGAGCQLDAIPLREADGVITVAG